MKDICEVGASPAARSRRLPCPFCGGKADVYSGVGLYWIACPSCKAETRGAATVPDAIAIWNTRATDAAHTQADEALEIEILREGIALAKGHLVLAWSRAGDLDRCRAKISHAQFVLDNAIHAGEPKNREAEIGDLVVWQYCEDWHVAILDEQRRQAFPTHGVVPIVVLRRAKVEGHS